MAGEGGKREYWPFLQNVNVSNGNLHIELGPGSCVTCGGASSGPVFPNPQDTGLHGPVLIYNGMGTSATDLGAHWMTPYDAIVSLAASTVTLIDSDGTRRQYTEVSEDIYESNKVQGDEE